MRWLAVLLLLAACQSGHTKATPTPEPTESPAPNPLLVQLQPAALDAFCAHAVLVDAYLHSETEARAYREFQNLDDSKILDERLHAETALLKQAPDVPTGAKYVKAILDRCAALGHDKRL